MTDSPRCHACDIPLWKTTPSVKSPGDTCAECAKMNYTWKIGDVFTNGTYYWKVVSIHGKRAMLQSLTTDWARTILLTYEEWNADSRWTFVREG